MPTIWDSATSTHWPGANSVEAVNIISTTQRKIVGLCKVARIISPGVTGASVDRLTSGSLSFIAMMPKITPSHTDRHINQPPGKPRLIAKKADQRAGHDTSRIPGMQDGKPADAIF